MASRKGMSMLTKSHAIIVADFAKAFPDSKQWFLAIATSRRGRMNIPLDKFFEMVNYDGAPELFAMHACILGNKALWLNPEWFNTNRKRLQDEMEQHRLTHGFQCVPAIAVKNVLKKT